MARIGFGKIQEFGKDKDANDNPITARVVPDDSNGSLTLELYIPFEMRSVFKNVQANETVLYVVNNDGTGIICNFIPDYINGIVDDWDFILRNTKVLQINGDVHIKGNLTIDGNTMTVGNNLVEGNIDVLGNLSADGEAYLGKGIEVTASNTNLGGMIKIDGTTPTGAMAFNGFPSGVDPMDGLPVSTDTVLASALSGNKASGNKDGYEKAEDNEEREAESNSSSNNSSGGSSGGSSSGGSSGGGSTGGDNGSSSGGSSGNGGNTDNGNNSDGGNSSSGESCNCDISVREIENGIAVTINGKTYQILNGKDGASADTTQLENVISEINNIIPAQASSENKLADKDFVNSSISSNTAYFIGDFNSLDELKATDKTLTNNDYAFVTETDEHGNTKYNRYKWNGTEWLFEYALNNSSFTSEQWKTINSNITEESINEMNTAILKNGDEIKEISKTIQNKAVVITVNTTVALSEDRQTTLKPSLFGLEKFDENSTIIANSTSWNRICFIERMTTTEAKVRVFDVSASSSATLTLRGSSMEIRLTYIGKV